MSHVNVGCGLTGRKVLVAEDDPLIAAELRDLLAREGVEVLGPAPTVGAAMAVIDSTRPDAAVLDVNLRDCSSAPLAKALRAVAVPIVLVTGYPRALIDDADLRDAPILPKPVRAGDLLSVLGRLLSHGRPACPA